MKLSFKNEEEIKTFVIKKQRDPVANRLALQKMLKRSSSEKKNDTGKKFRCGEEAKL
jgi:hypothetical protein